MWFPCQQGVGSATGETVMYEITRVTLAVPQGEDSSGGGRCEFQRLNQLCVKPKRAEDK